jgi:hypothetical protein
LIRLNVDLSDRRRELRGEVEEGAFSREVPQIMIGPNAFSPPP